MIQFQNKAECQKYTFLSIFDKHFTSCPYLLCMSCRPLLFEDVLTILVSILLQLRGAKRERVYASYLKEEKGEGGF